MRCNDQINKVQMIQQMPSSLTDSKNTPSPLKQVDYSSCSLPVMQSSETIDRI